VREPTRLELSRRQERDGMRRFGGQTNPRSGARWDRKNDGRTSGELVEFKRTSRRSITLQFTDLRDLEHHALAEGRIPVLGFELGGKRYVVLPERDYLDRVPARGDIPISPVPAETSVVQPGQMPGVMLTFKRKPLVRRVPEQRSGTAGQSSMSWHPSRLPRRVSGIKPVPGARSGEQREVRRLGRVLRTRAETDQEDPTS